MKIRRLLPLLCRDGTLTSSMGLVAAMESTATASGTVHLTYALWDPNEEVGYKKSIAVFEKSHPGITVSVEQIPYPAYQTKLQEEFASGSGPTSSGSTRPGCRPGSKTASLSTWPRTSRRPTST